MGIISALSALKVLKTNGMLGKLKRPVEVSESFHYYFCQNVAQVIISMIATVFFHLDNILFVALLLEILNFGLLSHLEGLLTDWCSWIDNSI